MDNRDYCYVCGEKFSYNDGSQRPISVWDVTEKRWKYRHAYCYKETKIGAGWLFIIILIYLIAGYAIGYSRGWVDSKKDMVWIKYTPKTEITKEYLEKVLRSKKGIYFHKDSGYNKI